MNNINILFRNNFYVAIFMLLCLLLMDFNQTQSSLWIGPYLSAASNFTFDSFSMYVDFDQVNNFSAFSKEEQFKYNFPIGEYLVKYDYLAIGFLFVVVLAKNLFFFLGDLDAVQAFQYLIHIMVSLIIFTQLKYRYEKSIFFIFYMINPIVLYFVNFPFYYFWQVVPSAIFAYYYLSSKHINNLIFVVSVIFAFSYITRPTVLFLILFFYILYGYRENFKKSIIATVLFFGLIGSINSHGFGPWHTMYVGIGAYKNKHNIKLSDESGYSYFKEKTGKTMNSSNVIDKTLHEEYYLVLKNAYFDILSQSPSLLIKNAILNVLSSYSFGYKVNNTKLIYLSIITGTIFMCLLLYTKQYIIFLAIGFASAGFTPYYPPIPAYMYGAYILLVLGIIGIINFFIKRYSQ